MTIQTIQQILQTSLKVIEFLLSIVSQVINQFGGKN